MTTKQPVSFAATTNEVATITAIAKRAERLAEKYGDPINTTTLSMDLTACHANGCKLDLTGLLNADRTSFLHDVIGIHDRLDRTTGKFRKDDLFWPRFAANDHPSVFWHDRAAQFSHVVFQYPNEDDKIIPIEDAFDWHDAQDGKRWSPRRLVFAGRDGWTYAVGWYFTEDGRLQRIGAGAYGDALVGRREKVAS